MKTNNSAKFAIASSQWTTPATVHLFAPVGSFEKNKIATEPRISSAKNIVSQSGFARRSARKIAAKAYAAIDKVPIAE